MRGFIVLFFVAVAYATPQYNYDNGAGSFGAGSSQSFQSGGQATWNKQFSIYSAPEDALDEGSSPAGSIASQKSLRVVFIKTPENRGLENAALQLAKSAGDQQTAIYVLNKQTDLGDLESRLRQISNPNGNKPEVHFVKYKTPQEAEHAQHSIQAQYNSLAGPTSVTNEGVAPVQSFVGALGGAGGFGGGAGGFGGGAGGFGGGAGGFGGGGAASSNRGAAAYLPPQFRRF